MTTLSKTLSFAKFHGAGNDFILIDDLDQHFLPVSPQEIQKLCDRRYGIGADGLIAVQPSERADYRMRYFNCDGKEADMCGNGLRCMVRFLTTLGFETKKVMIETANRIYSCFDRENCVEIHMPEPTVLEWEKSHRSYPLYVIDAGVRHVVLWVDHFDDFETIAPLIRHDPLFKPEGVNVNFVMIKDSQIVMRTFEKGVEKETKACGTGALAVAAVFFQILNKQELLINFTSGERLEITKMGLHYSLKGPANRVYTGILDENV